MVLVLLIAASVSTLSSITITASSTLTMDLIQPHAPRLDKVKAAWVTKGLCLAFVVLSYVIANSKTPILDMMSYSWGIISGSFLAPYALSLYWKGINRAGAWAGIIGGFATALPPLLAQLFFPSASRLFSAPSKASVPISRAWRCSSPCCSAGWSVESAAGWG